MTELDKVAIEIEQTVLGMLIENPYLADRHNLTDADFAEPIHAEIFAHIRSKAAAGGKHTPSTLAALLAGEPPIGDITVPEYIRQLYTSGFRTSSPGTIDTLKDITTRRRLAVVAQSLAFASSETRSDILAEAADALRQIDSVLSANRTKKTVASFYDLASDAIDELLNDDGSSRISTGIPALDESLGGWHRGQYAIMAGRPGMGKSMLAISAALRAARQGSGVLIFSLEMTGREIAYRCLSDMTFSTQTPVPYRLASAGKMLDSQIEKWARVTSEYRELPMIVDDQRGLTISEIAARVRQRRVDFERMGRTLDLIVVDHMGLLRASDRYKGNRVHEVSEVSDGLATLAKDADAAVIALSQLNRGTEGRENKRPTLADLRDSGSIEQDAHVVTFAYRKSYYLERMTFDPGSQEELQREAELEACRNTMELMIAKNRNGPTNSITLFCDPACNAVRDFQR